MRGRMRWLTAVLMLMAVIAAACSNSSDDDDVATDNDDGDTGAVDSGGDGDDERDTFVSISGVPGVSDDEISFAVIGTKSGNPLGTCILDCYVDGIEAYFDFRNDEGGLFGRDLVLGETLDDELAQNQVRSIDVISGEKSFGVFSATLLASGWGDLHEAGVPTFAWNIHATEFANRPSIFGHLGAACATCTGRANPFLASQAEATKVAAIGYGVSENSKVCTQTQKASFEQYADDIGGVEVAYFNDDLAFGLPSGIAPEVTDMKKAGVDYIATCIDLNGMKTLAQELDKQGMQDVVLGHPNTYDQGFVADAGGIFDGDFVTPQFLPFEAESDNAMQDTFVEFMEQRDAPLTEMAMIGWINADLAFTAILGAGPEFDRAKAISALNSETAYDAGGLVPPIDWTRQHVPSTPDDQSSASALECFAPVQVVDGAFETVADPATPWFCWDNTDEAWTEPEQRAFG